MSISDYVDTIIDYEKRLALNWRDPDGVVHAMMASMMRQASEKPSQAIADYWGTICDSHSWAERPPKLTRARVTCALCLGST